ncbi:pseudouridine synthase [Uliginosibacterium flavum]|uniref:Dual-specificity RNA pseudouridine synthase RluF n=1 Tax=Uliginosibacterium flavum TaxID=1396831 RepID=A0ABV2TKX7_9RHOO
MPDTKRSKLSLPGKPAATPSTERRTRAPLRGSSKPRPPAPGRHRAWDESTDARPSADRAPRDERNAGGERPHREGERPSFGDRPPRRDGERPSFGDRPQRDARPSFGDRPQRDDRERGHRPSDGPRREENRTAFGDRLPREEFRGGAGRGPAQDRPSYGDRPPRREGERPSFGDRPQRDNDRPAFGDRGAPRYEGNRPQRDNDRPAPRRDGERPAYGDRPARPTFREGEAPRQQPRGAEERRPYGDRPARDNDRPAPRREGERPAFGDRPQRNESPRTYAERPRRNEERDGPARPATFSDEQMPAAPVGHSFGRSRAEPRDESRNDTRPQAAWDGPRKAGRPEKATPGGSADMPVDQPGAVRLSKLMSELGLCSRREADDYIERGWVSVDGVVVDELGSKVMPHQEIVLAPVAEEIQLQRITILINKPIGYVSGQAEDGYEPAAVLITPENHWAEDPTRRRFESRVVRKLAPAGRLDIDSTGLLVLTQDGRIAKQLVGERSDIEKEYLVRVEGELSEEGMRLLHHGLTLDGVELQPAKVSWQNEDQLRFALHEGRKRQIRRMCEMVGLRVVGLKRIRIGKIPLGKLPVGQWRYLSEFESF